jgi:hypothetical protein
MVYHSQYPFLVPLLESLIFASLGHIDDILAKIPFPLFFVALLLFVYDAQKKYSSSLQALMVTAGLALLPVFLKDVKGNPSSGYAEVPLIFYYTVSAISLFHWIKDHKKNDLILAAVFIVFVVFTKKEGTFLWAMTSASVVLLKLLGGKQRSKDILRFCLIYVALPLVLLLPWFYFKKDMDMAGRPWWLIDFEVSHFTHAYITSQLFKVPYIIKCAVESLFAPQQYNLLWVLFSLSVFFWIKDAFSFPQVFFIILIFCNLAALFGAIVMYPHPWWKNFLVDMPRLLMLNSPLAAYFISYQLKRNLCY